MLKKFFWRNRIFLTIILAVIILVMGRVYLGKEAMGKNASPFLSFKEVEVKIAPGIVFLADKEKDCLVLPIFVSLEQSLAIKAGMENRTAERPLTPDLMKTILKELETEVIGVKITKIKESTFYALLVLKRSDQIWEIDSRPSDALALASRTKSPVYVKKELLQKEGINVCQEEPPLLTKKTTETF